MSAAIQSKNRRMVGVGLQGLVAVLLLIDAFLQFTSPPPMLEAFKETGMHLDVGPKLAVVTSICALLLLIPRTAMLGAILTTGFLGGAIAMHFRLGEIASPPQIICLALGVAMWAGLYLQDHRIRLLFPLRAPIG